MHEKLNVRHERSKRKIGGRKEHCGSDHIYSWQHAKYARLKAAQRTWAGTLAIIPPFERTHRECGIRIRNFGVKNYFKHNLDLF